MGNSEPSSIDVALPGISKLSFSPFSHSFSFFSLFGVTLKQAWWGKEERSGRMEERAVEIRNI